MATSEPIAAVRALATADPAGLEQVARSVQDAENADGYRRVLAAALSVAVGRYFPETYFPADVIRLVAQTRSALDSSGDFINPRVAELAVRRGLGQAVANLPAAQAVQAQVAVCGYLGTAGKLGDPDEFVGAVVKLLNEWDGSTQHSPD